MSTPTIAPITRTTFPPAPAIDVIDAHLASIRDVAPQLVDIRLAAMPRRARMPAQLEAVLTRTRKRARFELLDRHGEIADRSEEIGRFLGLRQTTTASIQDTLHALAALNPIGCWMTVEQQDDPNSTWTYERVQRESPRPDRLLEIIEALAEDCPWLARIDTMQRPEGSDLGFVRTRSFIRFVDRDQRERATLDTAHINRLLQALYFGDPDRFRRNEWRLRQLCFQLDVDPETLGDLLHDLTLPFAHTSILRKLLIDPPSSGQSLPGLASTGDAS